jgi:hypothetical protein
MLLSEPKNLELFDANYDSRSFNLHNDETRQKMSLSKKGKPRKLYSDETKQKISSTMKNRFKQHIQNTILDKYSMADTKLNKNNPTLSGKLH